MLGVYCTKLFDHIYNNLRLEIISVRGKKMNKVEIEEFDVCHQFAQDIQFLIPLVEREFVNITHLVFCNYFVISIYYNKNSYGNRIQAFIQIVTKEPQTYQVQLKIRCRGDK